MSNKKDLIYVTPKDGIEVVKMTTKKVIRCRFGYTIAKGSSVDVTIEAKNGNVYYSVHYPGSTVLRLSASAKDFEPLDKKPVKTNIKVGDEFWFESISYNVVWKDKVIEVTDQYAYFEKHHTATGKYHIHLSKLEKLKTNDFFQIYVTEFVKKSNMNHNCGDMISVSLNEKDLVLSTLERVSELKTKSEQMLERIREEFAEKLDKFQSLEEKEKEFKKRFKNL